MAGVFGALPGTVDDSFLRTDITFVSGRAGSTLAAGVTSVTFTGHQVGDLLIAVGGSQQPTDPTFTAGWTKITSCYYDSLFGSKRIGLVAYKVATSTASETVTFTGTGTSTAIYSMGYTFRAVIGIGAFTAKAITSGTLTATTTITFDALTLQGTNGKSALFAGTYNGTMTANTGGFTNANGAVYKLLNSSSPAFSGTVNPSGFDLTFVIELLRAI